MTMNGSLLLRGACSTGKQPAAVTDATTARGPPSMPVPQTLNFGDAPFVPAPAGTVTGLSVEGSSLAPSSRQGFGG